MRTGAIFARGSCRALKWMALVGMVFALGVGSAAAQIRLPGNAGVLVEVDQDELELAENGPSKPVRITVNVPAETAANTAFTVSLTIPADTDLRWATVADENSRPVSRTVTATVLTYTFRWEENTSSSQRFSELARLRAVEDDDTIDDEVEIAVSDGTNSGTLDVTIKDNDVQEYELVGPSDNKLDEGEEFTLQLRATRPFAAEETTRLRVELDSENDDSDYNFADATGTVQEYVLGDSTSSAVQPAPSVEVTLRVTRA